jgi:MFS family permease
MVFLVNLGRVVFAPLLEPLKATFGMDASTAGLIVSLAWIGSTVPRLPTGYLLTRVRRHRVVIGIGVVLTLANAFAGSADSVAGLAVGAFLIGVAGGGYLIAANPLVSELFPDRVGRVIGIHGTAAQLAAVGAPVVVGGVLAVADWRAVFHAMAAATVLATGTLVLITRRTDLPDAGQDSLSFAAAGRGQWPVILTGVGLVGLAGFVWNGTFNFYVTYLVEARGVSAGTARNLLTVVFVAGLPAFWFSGRLTERFDYLPLLLAVLAAFAVSLFAVTVAPGFAGLILASVAMGYVIHVLWPVADTFLLATFPDEHRSSAYALYSGFVGFVFAGGSLAVGTLADRGFAYATVFRAGAVLVGLLAVCLVALHRAGHLPEGGRAGAPAAAGDSDPDPEA